MLNGNVTKKQYPVIPNTVWNNYLAKQRLYALRKSKVLLTETSLFTRKQFPVNGYGFLRRLNEMPLITA